MARTKIANKDLRLCSNNKAARARVKVKVDEHDTALDALETLAYGTTDAKESCRCATTADHGLSGLSAIDGVTPVAGNRVLVWKQSTGSQNGIYVAASGAWARASDANTSAKVTAGLNVFVSEGTLYGNNWFDLDTDDPITLASTSLNFTKRPTLAEFASTATGKGADLIGACDTGSCYDATTVRGQLQEVKVQEDAKPEKAPVRCATTANVTLASVGLAATDGVTIVDGNRVLVWKQSTASENGIYIAHATAWTRATDADTTAKVFSGLECFVSEGTLYGGCRGRLLTANPITLDSTSLTFSVFRGIDSTGVNGKSVALGGSALTVGMVPVLFRLVIPDGSTVVDALTLDTTYGGFTVISAWAIKTGSTGGATDAVVLCSDSGGTLNVTDGFTFNGTLPYVVKEATSIIQSQCVFAAGSHLYVARTHTTDCSCILYVLGYRS